MSDHLNSKRPFWLHQFAEYVLGLALVAVGIQSPTPTVPCLVAMVIILHAAITTGPLSAFRLVDRRLHRVIDVGVIAFEVVAAVQPWFSIESTTRLIMLMIAGVHAFVWWQTSYAVRIKPPKVAPTPTPTTAPPATSAPVEPATGRGADIGRQAGRIVGTGVNVVKQMKAKRQQPPD